MPFSPKELLLESTDIVSEVEKLVVLIDEWLKSKARAGWKKSEPIFIPLGGKGVLDDVVLAELRVRYPAWEVYYGRAHNVLGFTAKED